MSFSSHTEFHIASFVYYHCQKISKSLSVSCKKLVSSSLYRSDVYDFYGSAVTVNFDDCIVDFDVLPRASPGQNSEAAHPANRKRRLLGTRHGQLLVLSCLTFGSCRIGLPLAAPSGNHACWDFFVLVFLVPEDFLKWLE